jgi:putative hydrolase
MDPVVALRQIAYYKDRAREDPRRVMAYRNAADIVEGLAEADRERHGAADSWQSLPGIGPKTAKVISQAWAGREPDALAELRSAAKDLGGGDIRAALRGDLHVHSNWSDGSAPIDEMMLAAKELGHEYCALTDHSPRLKVANGLSPERLRKQLDVIDELRETVAPMRILTGIEVDILEDGSLDQEPELLERLDVVVASVHSKLSMDAPSMTRRMIKAVTNPQADVLGHCTGRLVTGGRGVRPESKFDAEKVFTTWRWRSAACSPSTPTPTRPASWSFSAMAPSERWTPVCRWSGSSTRGPPTSCWSGRRPSPAGAASRGRDRGRAAHHG